MNGSKRIFLSGALAAGLLAQPQSLLACSVCYGAPDSGMAKGLVWGIVALLGVVVMVLAGVVMFFVHVGKRSATLADNTDSDPSLESIQKS